MSQSLQAPASRQKQFMDLYRQGKHKLATEEAEKLVENYPGDAFAWKALGNCLLQSGASAEASAALETALSLDPEDPLIFTSLARASFMAGEQEKARGLQQQGIDLDPDNAQGHFNMASMLYQMGIYAEAEKFLSSAEKLGHEASETLSIRSAMLSLRFRFQEGLDALNSLYAMKPNDPTVHNSLGNYYKDMANFEKAEWHYREAQRLRRDFAVAFSNEVLTQHYNPNSSAPNILEKSQEWSTRFKPNRIFDHSEIAKSIDRPLRVGLVSGNLRAHPVGWMITTALEQLPNDIELHAYTDSEASDPIAERIGRVCHWKPVYHLNHQQLAEKIVDDEIDILLELAGHGDHSRLPAIAMKPAPIIVKWVGMQISSMGIDAFDYFLSDSHETPAGVDHLYTEKLIRLPDDYICYQPPSYKPAITALPSLSNGYITFGCFNNPAKVNDTLLAEWAILLQQLPGSRLFLKGGQYSSDEVCERVLTTLEKHGVERSRVLLEGPSQHKELLESYNRVDIALDTWPYSGGLTTCEALLMGVPVVTHTGPTFAGRHSATHLCNAGMPELVTDNWDDYRKRVLDLASDLPSLAVIRAALRTYLEQSPICDAPRFARNLHKAIRAIWQRHCEDKAPAALTFNKGGQAWFEDETKPVKLPIELQHGFDWNLESPVTILDNGAGIATRSDAKELLGSGNIAVLVFDPIDALGHAGELAQYGEIQHFPHVTLGSGQPATLRGVEGENDITSLKPLASGIADSLQTLEIPSIALDSIEGLESLDVLALDDRHDNLTILEHGAKALEKTLLLQIQVRFNPTHENQADLGSLIRLTYNHGFQFYTLTAFEYQAYMHDMKGEGQRSKLYRATAVFLPNDDRIAAMPKRRGAALAYLLDVLYGISDATVGVLQMTRNDLLLHKFKSRFQHESSSEVFCRTTLGNRTNSLKDAKKIVNITREFENVDASELARITAQCEKKLSENPDNNTAFFLMAHALLSTPTAVQDDELHVRLKNLGWDHKYSLYEYWLGDYERLRTNQHAFQLSIIVVANVYKNEILPNIQALREQGGDSVEIVFVNNGAPSDEFRELRDYINIYVSTKKNSGAYLARNLGFIFSTAPLILFVDDDGAPQPDFLSPHIQIHKNHDLACLRGVYRSQTGNDPIHYNLGKFIKKAPPILEGNVSFSRRAFSKVGGWGDYILFGHGGFDISVRLFESGYREDQQLYTPDSILQHEYFRGEDHAKKKLSKQSESAYLLDALHNGIQRKLPKEFLENCKRKSYSQYGEDLIIARILKPEERKGVYVDIGAFHPIKYSNTALLKEAGWKGVNVDASQKSVDLFNAMRRDDINLCCVISNQVGEVTFYESNRGTVSTLSKRHRDKWIARGESYIENKVASRKLADIFETLDAPQVDFLNIDVEDAEMGVLLSNDWTRFKPTLIAIEIHDFDPKNASSSQIYNFLSMQGYILECYAKPTAIFNFSRV
ncbi:FkbM family methyltransferase [uncultured Salinicola sp.]|uniref:O-linked N-acetylglucosamine transferase family protein n=1 Tax=uncultured Salinicola sp. TaxID=1193542 RepID=UPI00261EE71D|nr:FkbM family methyltransferase [uncultured Salinicola sp.]